VKTKLTAVLVFAACTLSASQIVGVSINGPVLQAGEFPTEPFNLYVQYATGQTQQAEGYEYLPTPGAAQPWEWVEYDLTLMQAGLTGLASSDPNAFFDYEVAAALTLDAPSIITQISIWDVMAPPGAVTENAANEAQIVAAEAFVSSGALILSDFAVFDPIQNIGIAPSFIVQIADPEPPIDPAGAPEPEDFLMVGCGLVFLSVMIARRRALKELTQKQNP
jgi:hypothetical protein